MSPSETDLARHTMAGDDGNGPACAREAGENDAAFDDRDDDPDDDPDDAADSDAFTDSPEQNSDDGKPSLRPRPPPKPRPGPIAGKYVPLEPISEDRFIRAYVGPLDRTHRQYALMKALFGGRRGRTAVIEKMVDRWAGASLLPPKRHDLVLGQEDKFIWAPEWPVKEDYFVARWLDRIRQGRQEVDAWRTLRGEDAAPYHMTPGPMPLLCGPLEAQQDIPTLPGRAYAISEAGLPFNYDEPQGSRPTGWILDVGGIPTSISWQPTKGLGRPQLLAVAVVPHHDEEMYDYTEESARPDFQKQGTVQLWEFTSDPDRAQGPFMAPKGQPAILKKTVCLGSRAKRVLWSPTCNHLAILCGDGSVCVVEPDLDKPDGLCEKVEQPLANLRLDGEPDIKATAMTWVTFNRIAVGYTDGSIALWSLHPRMVLSRQPVHHATIMDMVSGYPTLPYLIASVPIGGALRLVDLQAPSYEASECENHVIYPHANLLAYSDLLLGFMAPFPSRNIFTTSAGFLHHSQFPHFRRIFAGESRLTCLAMGRTHPYLLVGASDGSLWAMNSFGELFGHRRESASRLRVFQHEHRSKELFDSGSPASQRGASRIIQGFAKVKNNDKRGEKVKPSRTVKKSKSKTMNRTEALGDADMEDDEAGDVPDPSRGIIYEPLTRITAVEWNPNEGYSCWAAAAMGSGLVRVMDLGLERDGAPR